MTTRGQPIYRIALIQNLHADPWLHPTAMSRDLHAEECEFYSDIVGLMDGLG